MILLGKGNTAEVYEYAEGKICKLFYEGYPHEYVELEFQNAREMYECGIKVPQPFQIVSIENRAGIIYEEIVGETLLSHMNEEPERVDEYLDSFVKLHRDILFHHSRNVLSYKEYLSTMVKNKAAGAQTILDKINALSEDDCILHGDFHPGNILIEEDGTSVVIDFMNVCHGPALYDMARTYFLIGQVDARLAEKYLQKMRVERADIAKYLEVIEICREYEKVRSNQ